MGGFLEMIGMNRERVEGIVRHALTTAGGALIAAGLVDESLWMELVGAVATIAGVLWSILVKKL